MTRYVIDAPTLLHLIANDVRISPRHQIVAPNLIRSQGLSMLFEAVRHGDLAEDLALQHHERLTELKMRLLSDRVFRRTAWKIAREHGWETTYDAEYLAVAKLQADALVTLTPVLAAKSRGRRSASAPRGARRRARLTRDRLVCFASSEHHQSGKKSAAKSLESMTLNF